jgi:ferritin
MKDELRDAFVEHMNAEFESYYLYLSMAGWFEEKSWPGFANWMRMQAEEERAHAMKFYEFLLDLGHLPKLLAIAEPKSDWNNPLEIYKAALEHEKLITSKIHQLYDKAVEEGHRASYPFLDWFVTEQTEEEATVGEIVDRMSRVAESPQGLMMMDAELGQREAEAM